MWSEGHREEVRLLLGDAFLAGAWDEPGLHARALEVLEVEPGARWLSPLVRHTLAVYRDHPGDRRREFHAWLDGMLRPIASREAVQRHRPALACRGDGTHALARA